MSNNKNKDLKKHPKDYVRCSLCKKRAVVHFGFSKPLCKEHFIAQIKNRVKKDLRRTGIIELKKQGKLGIVYLINKNNQNNPKSFLMLDVLEPILKKARVDFRVVKKKPSIKRRGRGLIDFIVIPVTSDDLVIGFLTNTFLGRKPCYGLKVLGQSKSRVSNVVSVLTRVMSVEAYVYYKLKNGSGVFSHHEEIIELNKKLIKKEYSGRKRDVGLFINDIEEKHPGTILSTLRSVLYYCGRNDKAQKR